MARKQKRRRRRPLGGWGFESGSHKLANKCKIVHPKGQGRRVICWDRRGKIKSNKAA